MHPERLAVDDDGHDEENGGDHVVTLGGLSGACVSVSIFTRPPAPTGKLPTGK